MPKKKIDISEEIIDTGNFLPDENTQQQKIETYVKNKEEMILVTQRNAHLRRKKRIWLGAVMFLFMVIGVFTIISVGVGFGKKLLDNTAEKARYNTLLSTLVVADPLPFESLELADQNILLASSIWSAVMNEDMEKYEKNDFAQTYLPVVDVDKYFARVFGTQYKLTHTSFSDQGIDFEFDAEKQAYIIPITSYPTGFTPQVAKIKSSFNEKVVTVGYISPATSWTDTSEGVISKYVDYIFQKQDKNFYLVAIRESEMKVETVAVDSTAKAKSK